MKERTESMAWVLLLTFGGLCAVLLIYSHQYSKGRRESREGYAKYSATSEAFRSVYLKLRAEINSTNEEAILIRPEDVRKHLGQGLDAVGALPRGLSIDAVYVAKEGVPLASGRFICFVVFGKRFVPFGLTSTGECRYAKHGEVKEEEFVPLSPP